MSESEVAELIKAKKENLKRCRAQAGVSRSLLRVLEDEIKRLETFGPGACAPTKSGRPQPVSHDDDCCCCR